MTMKRVRRCVGMLVVVVATVALPACDLGGPSGTGVIRVTLVSPYGADGAAVLELTGAAGPSVVTSEVGDTFYEHDGTTTRVVVILDEPGQIQFTLRVQDVAARPAVTLVQVADAGNRVRTTLDDYRIDLDQLEDLGT